MLMSNPVCLSHREREILQWTADGKSSGEIAIILSISESTVNFHHKNIQKKFDAPNKTLAAAYAAALGLILSVGRAGRRALPDLAGCLPFILL